MGRRGSNRVKAEIELEVVRGQESKRRVGEIAQEIVNASKEIERIKKSGGLGALAIGADKIRIAEKSVASLADELERTDKEILKLQSDLGQAIDSGDARKFRELSGELANVEESSARLRSELQRLPEELRESANESVGFLGDIDTGLQTIAGTISNLGAGVGGTIGGVLQRGAGQFAGIAGGIGQAGDVFAVAEQIPRLSAAFGTLSQRLRNLDAATLGSIKAIGAMGAALVSYIAVIEAGKRASEAARAPLKSLLDDLIDIPTDKFSELDIGTAITADNLEAVIRQQEAYAEQLRQQASDLGFVADEYDKVRENIGSVDSFVLGLGEVADAVGLIENPINEVRSEFSETETQLRAVTSNLELLNSEYVQQEILLLRQIELLNLRVVAERENLEFIAGGGDAVQDRIADIDRQIEATGRAIVSSAIDVLGEVSEAEQQSLDRILAQYGTTFEEVARTGIIPQEAVDQLIVYTANVRGNTEAMLAFVERARELNAGMSQLEQRSAELHDVILPLAAARDAENQALANTAILLDEHAAALEAEQAAINAHKDAVLDAQDEFWEFTSNRIKEALQAAARELQESQLIDAIDAAKQAEHAAAFQAELTSIREDGLEREATLLTRYNDQRLKLVEEFNKARVRAEQDFARTIERLNRDKRETELRRDVVGFLAVQRQVGEAQEDFQTGRERAREDLRDRLRELEHGHTREISQLHNQINEKLAAQQAGAEQELSQSQQLQQQLADLRQSWREQDAAAQRRAEFDAAREKLRIVQEGEQAVNQTIIQSYAAQLQATQAFGASAIDIYRSAIQALFAGVGQIAQQIQGAIPRFHGGGVMDHTGIALLKKDETVLAPPGEASRADIDAAMARYSSVGGGAVTSNRTFAPVIQLNLGGVGELVTPTELSRVVEAAKGGIRAELVNAHSTFMSGVVA